MGHPMRLLVGIKSEGVGGGVVDGGVGEGQREGGAVVPGGPLIHEPGAHGVGGFAEDEVEGAVVEVGEVGGEALGGAEAVAYLFDGDVVAALGLDAGAGWNSDEALEDGGSDNITVIVRRAVASETEDAPHPT